MSRHEAHWYKEIDQKSKCCYYVCSETGESRWASSNDDEWMEATDPVTGYGFLEHSVTGETKWKEHHEEEVESTDICWEELKDPISGHRYFYSNKSQESQWLPPTWMDYYCPEYKCIYYYNTKTHESQWERPNDFVEEAIPELPKEDDKEFELSAQDNGNEQDGNFIFSRPPSRASYPKSAPATPRGRIPCDIAMSCLSPSARAGSPNLLSKRPRLPPPVGYRGQDQDESQPRVKRGNFFYEKQNDMIMMEEFQEETNDMMDVEKYHPNPMA